MPLPSKKNEPKRVVTLQVVDEVDEDDTKKRAEKDVDQEGAVPVLDPGDKKRFFPSSRAVDETHVSQEGIVQEERDEALAELVDPENLWEEDQQSEKKVVPIGWLVLGLIVFASVGGLMVKRLLSDKERAVGLQRDSTQAALLLQEKEWAEDALLYKKISEVIYGFFSAESVEALLPLCRHQERVRPFLVDHYRRHEFSPVSEDFIFINTITPIALGDPPHSFIITVVFIGKERKSLLLEQTDEGDILVDWESAVSYLPYDWEEYIADKPTDPLAFRVYVAPDNHYSYEFSDEDEYQCFRVWTLHSDEKLFAYMKRSDPICAKLLRAVNKTSRSMPEPCILSLRFLENGEARDSVLVDRLVNFGWSYYNAPKAIGEEE